MTNEQIREDRIKQIKEHAQARPHNYHPDFHFLLSEIQRLESKIEDMEHEARIEHHMSDDN